MDAFNPVPPVWTKEASHSLEFCCPSCKSTAEKAQHAWINRYSPVISEDYGRRWQEFYQCQCGKAWWAWSSDRPPSQWQRPENTSEQF